MASTCAFVEPLSLAFLHIQTFAEIVAVLLVEPPIMAPIIAGKELSL